MLEVTLLLARSTGGIGVHARSLAAGLCDRGHHVRVLAPPSTHRVFDFAGTGAEVADLPLDSALDPRSVMRAAQLTQRLAAGGVVHAHGLRAGAVAGLGLGPKRPGRTPLVCTWHNALLSSGPRRWVDLRLQRFAARRADLTLGASADLVEQARLSGAGDARLGEVAAPRLAAASVDAEQTRRSLGVAGPLVLCLARLHPQKRLDLLVEAAGWLAQRLPGVTVAVAGEGPQRTELEQLIARRGAPVRLLGRRDDVADLLAAADVAVISSDWEARALVAQEALLAGVPLVSTAVGGIPALVGDAAELVPPGDALALGAALLRVLDDPGQAERLRAAGRRQAARWPDEDAVVTSLERTYDELLRARA